MPVVGALIHDDVDYATERATILSFHARSLHLYFLDEVHGDVGMRIAANEVGRLLTFNQVRVL